MTKLDNELDVTSNYLKDVTMDDRALESISDKELLSQFQRVAKMDNKRKTVVKELQEAILLETVI